MATKIRQSNIDASIITGNTELSDVAADNDVLLVYDTSAGVLKKIQATNIGIQNPTLSSVSPTSVASGDGTGNYTFTITGTGLADATPTLINDSGSTVNFDSFTNDSNTQITAVIAKSNLGTAGEPYDVKVTVAGALTASLLNQINVDQSPVFVTAAGSVGSFPEQSTISTIDIVASDPDSAGNVSFEIQSGSLPAGLSATTVNENGVSKYRITGTLTTDVSGTTVNTFVLRAVDAASNTSSRTFTITETPSGRESFTSSGTFSVPTGVTSADILVVAGGGSVAPNPGPGGLGGGGAGGLIYFPGYPLTPGGTVSVTVGGGGSGGSNGQDSVFDTLTAKGGGYGGQSPAAAPAGPGGSGGGGRGGYSGAAGNGAGSAIQPTQPGNSGAYGFGNPGGTGGGGPPGDNRGEGAGGGGAGAAGQNGTPGGANGGAGKAYTIADGTTSVYYAGGGGGGGSLTYPGAAGQGGQGGGGQGLPYSPSGADPANDGGANKGGGSGGSGGPGPTGGTVGGKGIVIVSY